MSGFLVIVFFYLVGETLAHLFGVPIPGAIVGLILLVATLFFIGEKSPVKQSIGESGRLLLHFFPLFLVPVVAGIIDLGEGARGNLISLIFVSLVALLLGLAITGLLAQSVLRRSSPAQE